LLVVLLGGMTTGAMLNFAEASGIQEQAIPEIILAYGFSLSH
jgi:hypothetical protein